MHNRFIPLNAAFFALHSLPAREFMQDLEKPPYSEYASESTIFL